MRPAQRIGAAAADSTPSGMGVAYVADVATYCWNVPGV